MEEENKYYIPLIEEFHVGFEYEILDTVWTQEELDFQFDLQYIYSLINLNQIRVKYLDKEDIESLGWEYIYNPKIEVIAGHLYILKDCKLIFYVRPSGIINISQFESTIFEGAVKNKSELNKLMKQLNIL